MNYGIHIKISTGSIHGPGTPSVRMATCTSCTPTTPELPPASDTPRVAESQVSTTAKAKGARTPPAKRIKITRTPLAKNISSVVLGK